jgi:hypothetical protein
VSLGVHFALTPEQEKQLLAAVGDDEVIAVVEAIEEGDGHLELPDACQTDKAWEAIHRCLADGQLTYDGGEFPLRAVILGGRQLVEEADYTVAYVPASDVPQIATALAGIDERWLRGRYDRLAGTDYGWQLSDDDFDYTWAGLQDVVEFYAAAADRGRAVIFTVDA